LQLAAGASFRTCSRSRTMTRSSTSGPSFRQIQKFRTDFEPKLVQLIENHRCPPAGSLRRQPACASQHRPLQKIHDGVKPSVAGSVSVQVFDTDAIELRAWPRGLLQGRRPVGGTAVLARTRAILLPIKGASSERGKSGHHKGQSGSSHQFHLRWRWVGAATDRR
jgi:hypothetical protein